MPLVNQELLTLPGHLSTHQVLILLLYLFVFAVYYFVGHCLSFSPFRLVFELFVLLHITVSIYPFIGSTILFFMHYKFAYLIFAIQCNSNDFYIFSSNESIFLWLAFNNHDILIWRTTCRNHAVIIDGQHVLTMTIFLDEQHVETMKSLLTDNI